MNKEKVTRILNEFDRMFPDAACELVHDNELELLIAVMLSAQKLPGISPLVCKGLLYFKNIIQ